MAASPKGSVWKSTCGVPPKGPNTAGASPMNAPGMGPEPRRVEGGDVAAPLLGRGEVGGQAVGVEALAHEVVAPPRAGGRLAMPAMRSLSYGQRRVEEHEPLGELGVLEREDLDDGPAEVAAAEHDPLEARGRR